MGGCWFALNDKPPDGVKSMLDALNATTGWDVSMDEALDAGHRAIILQSVFGTQRGWIAEHDWQDVGPRFLEPIPDGKYKGFTIAKWLPGLIHEYYRNLRPPRKNRPAVHGHAEAAGPGRIQGVEPTRLIMPVKENENADFAPS